ncbi:hypothetical protein C9410_12845 [Rhizobium sp. SEMIA 439]|nr:hypothetical protein C9410_12845 [Rhizobium sp. SEMIA 439]
MPKRQFPRSEETSRPLLIPYARRFHGRHLVPALAEVVGLVEKDEGRGGSYQYHGIASSGVGARIAFAFRLFFITWIARRFLPIAP